MTFQLHRWRNIAVCCVMLCTNTAIYAQTFSSEEIEANTPVSKTVKNWQQKAEKGDKDAQFRLGRAYMNGAGIAQNRTKGIDWIKKAADANLPEAQYWIGVYTENGDGIEKNKEAAVSWFEKASNLGFAEAQYALAMKYATGVGVTRNAAKALDWMTKAAKGGSAGAQYALGLWYRDGIHVKPNKEQAFYWVQSAAKQNHVAAQNLLGNFFEKGYGITQQLEAAKTQYLAAAKADDADAQLNLGAWYLNQKSSDATDEEAVKWIQKAAAQNHPEAELLLALCLQDGIGGKTDTKKAAELIQSASNQSLFSAELFAASHADIPDDQKHVLLTDALAQINADPAIAADALVEKGGRVKSMALGYLPLLETAANGNAAKGESRVFEAQRILGTLYRQGVVVPRNTKTAMQWYQKAADQNDAESQYQLAQLMEETRQNDETAAKLEQKAAEQGHPLAAWALAQHYATGKGIEKNSQLAFEWTKKAAEHNIPDAIITLAHDYRDGIGTSIQPDESVRWMNDAENRALSPAGLLLLGDLYLKPAKGSPMPDKALSALKKAAEQGNALGKYRLGLLYLDGPDNIRDEKQAEHWLTQAGNDGIVDAWKTLGDMTLSNDLPKAIAYYDKGAALKDPAAQYRLGEICSTQTTYIAECGNAVPALEESAKSGNKDAQFLLGTLYMSGRIVDASQVTGANASPDAQPNNAVSDANWKKAQDYFKAAAEQEHTAAQFHLGQIELQNGNLTDALEWLKKSANTGYAPAQVAVGNFYESGIDGAKQPVEAMKWYKMAADQQYADAQYRLGTMYETGNGVKKNKGEARRWYSLAAAQGHKGAENALKKARVK